MEYNILPNVINQSKMISWQGWSFTPRHSGNKIGIVRVLISDLGILNCWLHTWAFNKFRDSRLSSHDQKILGNGPIGQKKDRF